MTTYLKEWLEIAKSPKCVFLIDDSMEDCILIQRMSRGFNIQWEVVNTPQAALNKLNENCNYHLIILDLQLRSKLQGVDLFREIKKRCPLIPTLVLAGNVTKDDIDDLTAEGFVMFAQKPKAFNPAYFEQLFLALNIPKIPSEDTKHRRKEAYEESQTNPDPAM